MQLIEIYYGVRRYEGNEQEAKKFAKLFGTRAKKLSREVFMVTL